MMRYLAAALVATAASSGGAARADGPLACEREMTRASAQHGVPLNVLYSVGLTETGSRNGLSPYDMNVDGQAVHSASLAEAMARFAQAKGRGAKFIDIGCMQINHHFHSADFHSLGEMFDPARNVEYAANFLKSLKAQEGSWTLAVARYNAGPGNPAAEKPTSARSSATWSPAVSASGRLTRARSASSPKPLAVSESGSSLFNRLRRHFRVARRLESCELALLSLVSTPRPPTPHRLAMTTRLPCPRSVVLNASKRTSVY
jgi:hypothetical protein